MPLPTEQSSRMSPGDLCRDRFRQIHLDFHTSPLIHDVGEEFNPDEFAQTLVEARVNWVTLFGKCHHGMSYYPTKVGIGHPGLNFDLLGEQIEACRRVGIVTPVYISVHVDQYMAETQSNLVGWQEQDKLNHWVDASGAGWYNLCLSNTEYVEYLATQAEEVMRLYNPEGIFFDMCYYINCRCPRCKELIRRTGGDIDDPVAMERKEFAITREYTTRLSDAVRAIRPNATLFFNSRVTPSVSRELDILTHLEIESLPTGGWGYQFFPFHIRYGRTLGHPTQGMTARFHKSWGDFGGLKTPAQMEYEAGLLLASGSVMNIGDQLHPRGRLEPAVYDVIGHAFKHVEAREPWCRGAEAVAEIGVMMLNDHPARELQPNAGAEGATAMLLELKQQFNVVLPETDFSQYRLLILADSGQLDDTLVTKLEHFVANGGRLLVSHEASLDPESKTFRCPGMPATYRRAFPYKPCYTRPGALVGAGLPDGEFDYVLYGGAASVEPAAGSETYGVLCTSYFNRSGEHFCSHNQAPVDQVTDEPLVVRRGNVLYLAAPLFSDYRGTNYLAYKRMVANLLAVLLPDPVLKSHAPSAMEISLTAQQAEKRVIAHLVNYQPQRRQCGIEYIDEAWPVHNIQLALRAADAPKDAYLAPSGDKLPVTYTDGYAHVTVPEMTSHGMVVFQF